MKGIYRGLNREYKGRDLRCTGMVDPVILCECMYWCTSVRVCVCRVRAFPSKFSFGRVSHDSRSKNSTGEDAELFIIHTHPNLHASLHPNLESVCASARVCVCVCVCLCVSVLVCDRESSF